MGNIVLLDDLTINKIAAGEVIERPASVVKEMVENSIDAGAKNITVEIKNGGISLIRVIDDGCGISEDDMELAFERHATSKIRKAEDLESVKSMGFRGEALASVAAIANVEMISKKADSDVAHRIVVEGGKTIDFTEAARSVGTTITVQNLFYNTPVRYKFLKKDYTEAGYIEDAITRIALVNKDIAIKLISNGKTLVQTMGNGDMNTVIYSIYGKDVATETVEVNYEYEGIKVSGVVGKPVVARANRSNQLFFLNGRYIKDKNLSAAADQAYKGIIPVGRYGFIVLNLEMDPKLVDVNVHPAKLEVRFENESQAFKAVYHAIKSSLTRSELVETVEKEEVNVKEKEEEYDVEKKKKGLSGLFSKIIKEPEETVEELSNNHLEEIFKYRQSLNNKEAQKDFLDADDEKNEEKSSEKEITVDTDKKDESEGNLDILQEKLYNINSEKIKEIINQYKLNNKDTYEAYKSINDEEVTKKAAIGTTIISSDTKELEVSEIIDSTTEVSSIKKIEKDATQIIDSQDVKEAEKQSMYVTQQVDLSNVDTEIKEIDESQNTQVLNNNSNNESNNNIEDDNNSEKNKDEFAQLAEKLVEEKLGLDNTQMIDTMKIREALIEDLEKNPEFDQMYKKTFGVDTFSVRKEKEQEEKEKQLEDEKINASGEFSYASENMTVFEDKKEIPEIPYKFIGIVFNTYIIIEIKDEMYILDQHAAHERIMYERVKANYYSEDEKDEQFLLLPDVITLPHKEMIIAKQNKDMFAKAGFSFEEFGENTIKLLSVPSMCEDLNTKQLFLDILDEIDTVAVTARQEKEDKFIATVACKAAVKGKMKLEAEEVSSLMANLLSLPNPFTCPHGRPTAIKMTNNDLEKKFSRR